jgi:hypothetical protein
VTRAHTLWEEGTEPGRQVVVLGVAVTLTAVVLDLLVNSTLTLLFDLVFVVLCVALALLVRPRDFFTVGVLPPLLMLGAFWMLGILATGAIAHESDGIVQAVVTGLASHATALVVGYGLSLAILAVRQRVIGAAQGGSSQASNRDGSPAPTRTTSGTPSE